MAYFEPSLQQLLERDGKMLNNDAYAETPLGIIIEPIARAGPEFSVISNGSGAHETPSFTQCKRRLGQTHSWGWRTDLSPLCCSTAFLKSG